MEINKQFPFAFDPIKMAEDQKFLSSAFPFPDDFFLKQCIQLQMLNIPLPDQSGNPAIKKSKKTAATHLDEGEKALAKNQNNEALKAFTSALVTTPESSKKLIDCYIGRSMVLQKLKAYPESLRDIKRALKLPVTEEQRKKLLNRKTVIESLLSTTDFEKLNVNENAKEEIRLSYGENEEIPGVSSAMALVYNKEFGRHYVATRDIKVGDVLMIQKPFVFVSSPEFNDNSERTQWICDNCLNSTMDPIPCDRCTLPVYCSATCKAEAYRRYHKMECKILETLPPLQSPYLLFLRTLIQTTDQGKNFVEVANLMDKIRNCKDKRTAGFKDGKLDGGSPEALLSLLAHTDKQKLPQRVFVVALITDALRKHTDFLNGCNGYNDVLKLGELLLYMSYICQMNLYGIRGNHFNNKLAVAMYPVFNLLNNACSCNTLWYDDKQRRKVLRACKTIKKGEQVFVAYLTFEILHMKPAERRDFFQKFKYFTCHCEACERGYTYKSELKGCLKVSAQLKKKLIKKPNDTDSLWELLKLVLNKYNHPSLEAKTIELALVNAYLGSANKEVCNTLRKLRVL